MEFLKHPIPNSHQIFTTISVFPPQIPIRNFSKNRLHTFRVLKSSKSLFTSRLASSTPQSFRFSPHFGWPTRRRNSLRKKLVDDQKVRQKPLPLDPNSEFRNPHLNFNENVQEGADDEIRVYNSANVGSNVQYLGSSNLLTKLENWVDQYRRDVDSEGNVREVSVNEDEILCRNQDVGSENGELSEVNSKILYAKNLAREMERGGNVIPRNSSVAKFVVVGNEELGLVGAVQAAIFRPDLIPKVSKVGALVVCCVVIFWVVKNSFSFRNKEKETENGGVEVMQEAVEPPNVLFEKPKLDRKELMDNMLKAKAAKDALASNDSSRHRDSQLSDFDRKVEEIKVMARQAREIESRDRSMANKDEKGADIVDEEVVSETEVVKQEGKEEARSLNKISDENGARIVEGNGVVSTLLSEPESDRVIYHNEKLFSESGIRQESHEGSDGSMRPGKKSGKEFWMQTEKWSHGFLESYNAETDPETKSIMKDIGKDLDRWITEEEIGETKDLISKVPAKQKQFIEKKLNKLKPEAVVSKYREYAEKKEEDYFWWSDLPHVLCIGLYTTESEKQKIGLYALEMAGDLELEPKPVHVIAFEHSGDCRNLCYIIQSHLEMLGNGHAFVVARSPKDVLREAKEDGFGITVIRKEELKLNVDQTLEEVEEEICEIHHDKITKEQSVDVSTLMKEVLGFGSSSESKKSARRNQPNKTLDMNTEKQNRVARTRNEDH